MFDHVAGAAAHRRPFSGRLWTSAFTESLDETVETGPAALIHDASFGLAGLRAFTVRFPSSEAWLVGHLVPTSSIRRREGTDILDRAAGVIAVSHFVADSYRRRYPAIADRVRVVQNGVDTDVFAPTPQRPAPSPRVVLAAGITSRAKGTDCLAEAWSLVRTRDVELRIAGGSWYDAGPSQISPSISTLGFIPHREMPDFLRSGTVFVYPSLADEAFGLGLLEAMATGLACVTTRVGGIPEAAGDAVRYVPAGDPLALARAIDDLLADEAQAIELGRRARARAELFSTAAQSAALDRAIGR